MPVGLGRARPAWAPAPDGYADRVSSQAAPTGSPGGGAIVVLTEVPLHPVDAQRIVGLHPGEDVAYRVLVPADTERNVLVSVLDHLSLFAMRELLESLRPVDLTTARADAQSALDTSVRVLQGAGASATGEVTDDDPLPALEDTVRRLAAREVVIVTQPHAVEDTFHTDWASRARDQLGLPVLHLYAGDWRLG